MTDPLVVALLAFVVTAALTVVVLVLLAVGLDEPGLLDVALVYALLNFLLSLGLSSYAVERGGIL